MEKIYQTSLHIFRRDLRLHDNTALIQALASSRSVIPCFIFDKRQIQENDYKSDNCIQFMLQSLSDLNKQLQSKNASLYFFYGLAEEIVTQLIKDKKIQAVFINRDYTKFSRQRDHKIENICLENGIGFHSIGDTLLHEPQEVYKPNGQAYTVFTPFFNKASSLPVNAVKKNPYNNYFSQEISFEDKTVFAKLSKKSNPNLFVKGGRQEALSLLKKIAGLRNYAETRNFPALNSSTHLSAHNKFGTLSIRELYAGIVNHFGSEHTLIKELYWRDFFTHIAYHFPHVFGHAFHEKYENIIWSKNEKYFHAWREGRTGFPIVDAGMRELNATGYMHNRLRMITASFLVKDLHIDWRWGEKYFAQKLVDYDPAVNNGNWQWAASTGCDAQPYFRIFNPWLQQEKFDADCLYIKQWIPELARIPAKMIHGLGKNSLEKHDLKKNNFEMNGLEQNSLGKNNSAMLMTNYPSPIINHALESRKTKALYEHPKPRKV
jgi:deoxyribodipyrimidine photo-lyase